MKINIHNAVCQGMNPYFLIVELLRHGSFLG